MNPPPINPKQNSYGSHMRGRNAWPHANLDGPTLKPDQTINARHDDNGIDDQDIERASKPISIARQWAWPKRDKRRWSNHWLGPIVERWSQRHEYVAVN